MNNKITRHILTAGRRFILLLCLLPLAFARSASVTNSSAIKLPNGQHYDATTTAGLYQLMADVDQLCRKEEQFLEQRKAERKRLREATPLARMSFEELKTYYAEPPELPTNNELRGLRELQRLGIALLPMTAVAERARQLQLMVEVARSIENLHRTSTPIHIETLAVPFLIADHLHNPIGKGTTVAANIFPGDTKTGTNTVDPPDSTFWTKPKSIADADLFHSPGRTNWPDFKAILWEYDEPKTSSGSNPGFEVQHGQLHVKVKFAEAHSEPFASRLFYALGYNAEQTDYVPGLRLKYNRRIFREFHQRKEMTLRFTILEVIPGGRFPLQKRFDPFDFIAAAVLSDGTRWTGPELRQHLLVDPRREHAEDDPANFNEAVEKQIDYLVTTPANVQLRDPAMQNIGPWEFGGLGHENLRELRGAALLAAWIGWFDSRFENTRLKIVARKGVPELRHYFTDLGSGLGNPVGMLSWQTEDPNVFAWTFTEAARSQSKGEMTIPFRIVNYRPIDDTPAFAEMTVEDARWMARMIGRLTENQLVQALVASGFDSAETRLFTEKLISRRDKMVRDLGLEKEIPLLRPMGVDRQLAYDPSADGPMTARLRNGETISARASQQRIVDGRIETAPAKILENAHASP